ncbi:unnamed protein product [Brassicogethes aeneus]|uniref:Uncharacterized protein n=1 Tax=Brassicogethes aeneus TaxID=1431903 RepID=A0A9P0B592_BRAAE|nr:unnamed protein product [Brassicogethes aeneus]
MKIAVQNVIWVLMFAAYNYLCLAKDSITIAALFDEKDSQAEMPVRSMVYAKNIIDQKFFYKVFSHNMEKADSFACSQLLCKLAGSEKGIAAVFGPASPTCSAIIQSMTSFFEIPHIQTSWKPAGSPLSSTVVNFFPEADLFSQGLAEIVRSLQWEKFVIVYETEEALIKLQEVLKLQEYDEESKIGITFKQLGSKEDYRPLLKDIETSSITRVILDCHLSKIIPVLQQAQEVNMLEIFHSFFLTHLDAHTLDLTSLNSRANITTVRLFDTQTHAFKDAIKNWELMEYHQGRRISLNPASILTESILTHDAILLFIDTLNALQLTQFHHTKPIICNETEKWPDGFAISNFMRIKQPSKESLSGPLKFDDFGRRIDFQINCVDISQNKTISIWSPSKGLNLSRNSEENTQMIIENLQKSVVIVASRLGRPYLAERKKQYEGEQLVGNARYEGYAMDLVAGIAEILNFTFEFKIVKDYGKPDPITKKWNGVIGEVIERRAHLAICDLTINHMRREVVDFSMPFMTLGISILHKKQAKKEVNMFAFLDPFSISVWIYTATLYLAVSVILYFVARMAPGDWENPHPCDENPEELENIWDIKNCLWLTMGSIMTQGCDILPKGFSSRMATSMWWFFSLIMTSSYTANLAAFLTMERMEPAIDSAEALSKQTKIKYGTVNGGSTQAFFRDSNYSTYQRMWISMDTNKPSVFEDNNEDGVNRVLTTKNGLYAFLMESSQIEYFVQTKCELKQVGTWLDSKGYGIAMPMNSPYRSEINKAVLKMQEEGRLQTLKTKWWKDKRDEPSCDDINGGGGNSSELALANVGGVFLVLVIGVAIAIVLAIMEFLWNVRNLSVQEHMSYWEALKVEVIFACNIWVTKKRTKPEVSESSSSKSSENGDNKSIAHSILHNAGSIFNLNKHSILNLNQDKD